MQYFHTLDFQSVLLFGVVQTFWSCARMSTFNFWINKRKLTVPTATQELSRTSLKTLFCTYESQERTTRSFACITDSELRTVQVVGASKVSRPLHKRRQNLSWSNNKLLTHHSAQRISQEYFFKKGNEFQTEIWFSLCWNPVLLIKSCILITTWHSAQKSYCA